MSAQLAVVKDEQALVKREFNQEERNLIKQTVALGASDAELALFLYVCQRRGLDPLVKQIHFVKRKRKNYDTNQWEEYGVIQTGIDGFRLIAERTGRYDGQLGPYWCGSDGQWTDVWLSDKPPAAAKVGVLKRGWREPMWGVARWTAYVQTTSSGITQMWQKMGAELLAKCAEALAFRKAFPEDLSGLYTSDEMMQADNAPAPVVVRGEVIDATPRLQPPAADAPPAQSEPPATGKKVSVVSKYQREQLARLVREVYGDASDEDVTNHLDDLFVETFGHNLNEATYNEGAHITAMLLSKQRKAADGPSDPPRLDAPPAPNGQDAPRPPLPSNLPTRPDALLTSVNGRVEVPYDNIPHLWQALRNEYNDPRWQWPQPRDLDGWRDAYARAFAHAQRKVTPASPVALREGDAEPEQSF